MKKEKNTIYIIYIKGLMEAETCIFHDLVNITLTRTVRKKS